MGLVDRHGVTLTLKILFNASHLREQPCWGQMRIYNQFTETFSVNELAEKVRTVGEAVGLEPRVQTIKNPRKEKEDHYYNPKHSKLADLGLRPTPLTDDVLVKLIEFVKQNKNNIDETKIYEGQYW